jgi:RNA polymerase sigma factor (sigma-70 family)
MNEIVRRFDRLAVRTAKRLTPDHHLQEDLANAARLAVVVAVRKHVDGRPGFPSYVRTYMVGAAKRKLGRWISSALPEEAQRVGVDDEIDVVPLFKIAESLPPTGDRTWGSSKVARAIEGLGASRGELLQLRFIEDMTLSSIAKLNGTSESAVSQRLASSLKAVELVLVA